MTLNKGANKSIANQASPEQISSRIHQAYFEGLLKDNL